MEVQSCPPSMGQPPQDSMLLWVSMHSKAKRPPPKTRHASWPGVQPALTSERRCWLMIEPEAQVWIEGSMQTISPVLISQFLNGAWQSTPYLQRLLLEASASERLQPFFSRQPTAAPWNCALDWPFGQIQLSCRGERQPTFWEASIEQPRMHSSVSFGLRRSAKEACGLGDALNGRLGLDADSESEGKSEGKTHVECLNERRRVIS